LLAEGPTPDLIAQAATLDDAKGETAARFRYLRALALDAAERTLDALPLLRSAIDLADHDRDTAARARALLATALVVAGDSAAAVGLVPALLDDLACHDLDVSVRVAAGIAAAQRIVGREPSGRVHAILDTMAAMSPEEPELLALRAVAHAAEGDVTGADAAIACVRDRDEVGYARLEAARRAHRRGDNGAAIRWCRELLTESPAPRLRNAARLCLGMASWHAGRYPEAEAAFAAIVADADAHPDDIGTAWVNLAVLALSQGQALTDDTVDFLFAPEREELPHPEVLHCARGMHLLSSAEDPARALEAFDAALIFVDRDAEPDHAIELLALRALALAALDRRDDGERSFAEAEALAPRAGPATRARLAQLRGIARGIADDRDAHAVVDDDLREAERGFAATGRVEVVTSLRVRRAVGAAQRGDLEACLALLDDALASPEERVEAYLACASAAHDDGHIAATLALCDHVLGAHLDPAVRDRAVLQRCVALAALDGARAIDEATAHLATASDSRANRQLRVNRIGMLIDLGRPVPVSERAFLLDDARLVDALWPDVVRATRATLWRAMAMPDRARAELAEMSSATDAGRRTAALHHVLLAYTYVDAGRADAARQSLRQGLALCETMPPHLRAPILMLAGSQQTLLESPDAGRGTLRRVLDDLASRGVENATTRAARIHLALACAMADSPDATEARETLVALLADPAVTELRALGLRTLGIIDGDPARLLEASACYEHLGDLWSAAGAAEFASVVAEGGDSIAHLRRALALVERQRTAMCDGRDRVSLRRAAECLTERLTVMHALDEDLRTAACVALGLDRAAELDAAVAAIPPGALALSLLLGNDALSIVAVADGDVALRRAPWTDDAAAALALVDGLGALLASPLTQSDALALTRALDALSACVLGPVADLLDGREALVVAPGPSLGGIPFAALSCASQPLVAQGIACTRLLALGDAPALSARRAARGAAVLLRGDDDLAGGPSLPAADVEVERVASRLRADGWAVTVRRDADLTELGAAAWIHYAGHVRRADETDTDGPCLFLGGARIDAATLRSLTLRRAPVVVLSGCESGVLRRPGSDAHEGLVRPFLAAGAGAVVSSRWPVSDARTLAEMDRFYAALGCLSPARALARAARETYDEIRGAGVPEVLARIHAANFHAWALP
jgi:CHAT domain-containing protein